MACIALGATKECKTTHVTPTPDGTVIAQWKHPEAPTRFDGEYSDTMTFDSGGKVEIKFAVARVPSLDSTLRSPVKVVVKVLAAENAEISALIDTPLHYEGMPKDERQVMVALSRTVPGLGCSGHDYTVTRELVDLHPDGKMVKRAR